MPAVLRFGPCWLLRIAPALGVAIRERLRHHLELLAWSRPDERFLRAERVVRVVRRDAELVHTVVVVEDVRIRALRPILTLVLTGEPAELVRVDRVGPEQLRRADVVLKIWCIP